MKKTLLLLFYFTCCILHFSSAQNPLVKQWDKRFGGTGNDLFNYFQQTKDGGFILGGFSRSGFSGDKTSNTWGNWDYWIVKTDSFGNKQWDKDLGGNENDFLISLDQTTDGGYILGGNSVSGIGGDKTQNTWGGYDYWILKIDSLGNKEWDKDYGGAGFDEMTCLQQTTDGGFIIGGYSQSGISGNKTQINWDTTGNTSDFWIIKIDSLGNMQWDKDLGGSNDDLQYSILQTFDKGYILGGSSESDSNGDKTQNNWGLFDYWIMKIDSLGIKQWNKDYGGSDYDILFSIQQTPDAGYILGGRSNSDISGDKTQSNWDTICTSGCTYDYWIIKIDSTGNKQWDKDFGGTEEEEAWNVKQTTDGGFLISGDSYSDSSGDKTENNLGFEQTWIVKTDSLGNFIWDKTIFTSGYDEHGLAIQTKDGCFVFANATNSGIGGYKTQQNWDTTAFPTNDYWIIKFCDSTLTTGLTPGPSPKERGVTIAPNPANDVLVISDKGKGIREIEIVDLFGRRVLKSEVRGQRSEVSINVASLSPGIYFLKVGNEVRKFVKE